MLSWNQACFIIDEFYNINTVYCEVALKHDCNNDSLFCSPSLHLFDPKYRNTNTIMKYSYYLKWLLYIFKCNLF